MGEHVGSKLGLQCRVARNVIFMAVSVDNAANREVVQRFDQLTDSVGAAGIYHETVNPVGRGKVKASAGYRAGQAKFSYFTDLFDLYHSGLQRLRVRTRSLHGVECRGRRLTAPSLVF